MSKEKDQKGIAMAANIRLTSELRERIKKALVAKKFEKRRKDLQASREALAVSVYEAAYSAEDRRKMNRLPAGWLAETASVSARLGSHDFHQEFSDKKPRRIPAEKLGRYGGASYLLSVGSEHALSVRHADIIKERDAIDKEENNLQREIDAVLYSVATANRLVTVWPEVTKTVEEVCKTYVSATTLPAPRVEFLNKALGLTPAA